MKKIEELTEQEIRNLSYDDIELLIKFKKAEEGVKFVTRPVAPEYFPIPEKDMRIYQSNFLGNSVVFSDIKQLKDLIEICRNKGVYKVEYGVDSAYYVNPKLHSYSGEWDGIESKNVYSYDLYTEVKELLSQNKKLKETYEKDLKEYTQSVNDSKWIESEIRDRVQEVNEKYNQLENYCIRFKNDYLPLADNNESIAMAFMIKAYSLTEEQQDYIINNYEKTTTKI